MQITIDVTSDQIRTLLTLIDETPMPRKVSNPLYESIAQGVHAAHMAVQRANARDFDPPPPDGGVPKAKETKEPDAPSIAQSEVVPMPPRAASKKSKVHRQAK